MFRRNLLLAAIAAFAVAPAFADRAEVIGVGASQCKAYLAVAKSDAQKDIYVQWVSGMITGVAALTNTAGAKGLTIDSVAVDLKRYCTDHPSQRIIAAAGFLAEPYMVARIHPLKGG